MSRDQIDSPRWTNPWADQPLWISIATWVGVLVPIVAAAVWATRQSFLSGQDRGLMELQVMDVFTTSTPLTGVYSRFGWHHPGPWPLWIMAVPYRLLGSSHGLLIAAAIANLMAAVLLVMVLRRSMPSWMGMLSCIALLIVMHSFEGTGLADPWNPWIAVLPAILAAVSTAFTFERYWFGLIGIASATFASQSHIGFVPSMAAATLVALFWIIRPILRKDLSPSRAALRLLPVLGVLLLSWGPVAIEQFTHHPGNVSLLLEDAVNPPQQLDGDGHPVGRVTLDKAVDLVAQQFSLDSAFATHYPPVGQVDEALGSQRWWLIWPTVCAVIGVVCWRRGSLPDRRYLVASWIQVGVAILATSRLFGVVFPYQLAYGTVAVFLLLTATVWIAGAALFKIDRTQPTFSALGVALISVLAVTTIVDFRDAILPEQRHSEVMHALWPPALRRLNELGIDEVSIAPGPTPWLDVALGIGLRRSGLSELSDGSARCTLTVRQLDDPVPDGWSTWSTWIAPSDDEVHGGLIRQYLEARVSTALLAGPGCVESDDAV